jgi:hypothetical protein
MSDYDLFRVAEAMRAAAAELAGRNADIIRRNGYADHADVQQSIAERIGRLDVGAIVDKALANPPPALDEIAAFEQEARCLYINDFRRRPDGLYSYGLTQRFWEMWRAGGRFANRDE